MFNVQRSVHNSVPLHIPRSRASVLGIVTGFGVDGPGIEPRWGEIFPTRARPVLKPNQPPIQWVPGLSRG
jgi:hypothetical protein